MMNDTHENRLEERLKGEQDRITAGTLIEEPTPLTGCLKRGRKKVWGPN